MTIKINIKHWSVYAIFSLIFRPETSGSLAHMYLGLHQSKEEALAQLRRVLALEHPQCEYDVVQFHSLPVEDVLLAVDYPKRFSDVMKKAIKNGLDRPVKEFLTPYEVLYINSKINDGTKSTIHSCSATKETAIS